MRLFPAPVGSAGACFRPRGALDNLELPGAKTFVTEAAIEDFREVFFRRVAPRARDDGLHLRTNLQLRVTLSFRSGAFRRRRDVLSRDAVRCLFRAQRARAGVSVSSTPSVAV